MRGKDLDPDAPYLTAVNTYLVHWGFVKDLLAEGRGIRDTRFKLRDALADYIRAHSPIAADHFPGARLTEVGGGPPDGAGAAAPRAEAAAAAPSL